VFTEHFEHSEYPPLKSRVSFVRDRQLMLWNSYNAIFKNIQKDISARFDIRNFEKNYDCFSEKNKYVIGMMKSERGQNIISEFCGLRAKLYYYKMFEGDEQKKC